MNLRIPSPLAHKLHWKYTYCSPISWLARRRFSLCRSLARSIGGILLSRSVCCTTPISQRSISSDFDSTSPTGVVGCIDVCLWYVKIPRRSLRAGSADESRRGHASPLNASSRVHLNFWKFKPSVVDRCTGVYGLLSVRKLLVRSNTVHACLRKRWHSQRNVARGELAARPVSPWPQGRISVGPFPFLSSFRAFF